MVYLYILYCCMAFHYCLKAYYFLNLSSTNSEYSVLLLVIDINIMTLVLLLVSYNYLFSVHDYPWNVASFASSFERIKSVH